MVFPPVSPTTGKPLDPREKLAGAREGDYREEERGNRFTISMVNRVRYSVFLATGLVSKQMRSNVIIRSLDRHSEHLRRAVKNIDTRGTV